MDAKQADAVIQDRIIPVGSCSGQRSGMTPCFKPAAWTAIQIIKRGRFPTADCFRFHAAEGTVQQFIHYHGILLLESTLLCFQITPLKLNGRMVNLKILTQACIKLFQQALRLGLG